MRNHQLYLKDILTAIKSINEFVGNMTFKEFQVDDKTTSAVIKKLEIIGEAVKGLPDSVQQNYHEVPWREMVGMRDKLIHFYFGVDHELVWMTIEKRLPEVKQWIIEIIKKYP